MVRIRPITISLLLMLLQATSTATAVGCSPHIGRASINEISQHSQSCDSDLERYVEIKLMDDALITGAAYNDWTLVICTQRPTDETPLPLSECISGNAAWSAAHSAITSHFDWLTFANGTLVDRWVVLKKDPSSPNQHEFPACYVDVNPDTGSKDDHGMEVLLLDGNGLAVDYFTVDGHNTITRPGCDFSYDIDYAGSNGFNVQRLPDGTGCWPDGAVTTDESAAACIGIATPPGASGDESENSTNDGETGLTLPFITFSDILVVPGEDALFRISLTDAAGNPVNATEAITITYFTLDGTALATDGDYSPVASASITIPAGQSFAEFTIATAGTATPGENFYVVGNITSTTSYKGQDYANAIMVDNFSMATFTAPPIHHYLIEHSGQGVTCEAELITITAHDINDNPVVPAAGTTLTLSSSTINAASESWSLQGPAGTFTAPDQYTFDGSSAFVQLWYSQTIPEQGIDLDVSDGSIGDIDDGGAEDPPIDFADSGLRLYADGVHNAIYDQIAGKPSNVAPHAQTLTLRAVETDTDTGACVARLTGLQTLQLAYECLDPAVCHAASNDALTVEALAADGITITATAVAADNPAGAVAAGTAVYNPLELSFDDTGTAYLSLRYADAGRIQLFTSLSLPETTPDPAIDLAGSSNPFVVSPFGFAIDFSADRATNGTAGVSWASDALGSVFQTAGEPFAVSLRAVQWQAVDDANQDGLPDSPGVLYNNATTPAFGSESSTEAVVLTHSLAAPVGGNAGELLGHSPLPGTAWSPLAAYPVGSIIHAANGHLYQALVGGSSGAAQPLWPTNGGIITDGTVTWQDLGVGTTAFTDGLSSLNISWSEVGIIDLQAQLADPSYLGATDPLGAPWGVSGSVANVGRFIPAWLAITTNPGAAAWAANTPYTTTDSATPALLSRNGHLYQVIVAGTSGASEPLWPVDGGTVLDGSVQWQDLGPVAQLADANSGFTYLGQAFGFLVDPVFTLTAHSSNGEITGNYGGDFFKLGTDLTGRSYTNTAITAAELNCDTNADGLLSATDCDSTSVKTPSIPAGHLDYDGTATLTLSGEGLVYTKPITPEAPFDALITLSLQPSDITDTDGVCVDPNHDASCDGYRIVNLGVGSGGTELRYGRLTIHNAYGPEVTDLPVPMLVEYYAEDSSGFVANNDDTTSTVNVLLDFSAVPGDNLDDGESCVQDVGDPTADLSGVFACSVAAPAGQAFTEPPLAASFNLYLAAPGSGNEGSVDISANLDSGASYLDFDWDGDGTMEGPSGRATFGIYRGNDRQIYLREILR